MRAKLRIWLRRIVMAMVLVGYVALPPTTNAQTPSPDLIFSVAWSYDGKRLATGHQSGTVKIWSVTAKPLLTLTGHTARVNDVVWSPDDSKLVSASNDGTLHIWNTSRGTLLHVLKGHEDFVIAATWSPDGSKIISGSIEEPQNLRVWNATTGASVKTSRRGSVERFIWSLDGTKLVYLNPFGAAIFLDGTTFDLLPGALQIPADAGGMTAVTWSPDGGKLVTGGVTGKIQVWSTAAGQIVAHLQGTDNQVDDREITLINSLAFSQDGSKLYSTTNGGLFRSWIVANWQIIATRQFESPMLANVAWNPDRTQLAYGESDRSLRIRQVASLLEQR